MTTYSITVMDKGKSGLGFHSRSPIVRGRAFHPRAIGDPRGRAAGRASSGAAVRSIVPRPPIPQRDHCALRAPTVFLVRMKSASAPKTRFWIKAKAVWGFDPGSPLAPILDS